MSDSVLGERRRFTDDRIEVLRTRLQAPDVETLLGEAGVHLRHRFGRQRRKLESQRFGPFCGVTGRHRPSR